MVCAIKPFYDFHLFSIVLPKFLFIFSFLNHNHFFFFFLHREFSSIVLHGSVPLYI